MKIKKKRCKRFFWSILYKIYFRLILLNFKILAFFWRQFYQEKRKRLSEREEKEDPEIGTDPHLLQVCAQSTIMYIEEH